jgi:hypothetical protein
MKKKDEKGEKKWLKLLTVGTVFLYLCSVKFNRYV